MKKRNIKTAGEARQFAIDWQHWQSEQNLSYAELFDWQAYFEKLAGQFDLLEEFKEEGIL